MVLRVVGFAATVGLFVASLFFLVLGIGFLKVFLLGLGFLFVSWPLAVLSLISSIATLWRASSRKLGASFVVAGFVFLLLLLLIAGEADLSIPGFLFVAAPHIAAVLSMIIMGSRTIAVSK